MSQTLWMLLYIFQKITEEHGIYVLSLSTDTSN
jgi:hypothetical protein